MNHELPLSMSFDASPADACAVDVRELELELASLAPGNFRYCLARTASRARAEDVAQDALAALVDRAPSALGVPPAAPMPTAGLAAGEPPARIVIAANNGGEGGEGPHQIIVYRRIEP